MNFLDIVINKLIKGLINYFKFVKISLKLFEIIILKLLKIKFRNL